MNKGFTILELIVVTSLLGFFAMFMLSNYRGVRSILAEQRSAQTVAQAIRSAQNKALASDCVAPPCRFGAHFDTLLQKIEIFNDVNSNFKYDQGEELITESYMLEPRVSILGLSSSYLCGSAVCLDIIFDPPDPTVTFNPQVSVSVSITTTGGKTVTAGKGGSVDVN